MKKHFKRIAKQCAAVLLGAALVLGAGDFFAYRGISVYAAGTDEASATAVTASDTKWTSGFYKVSGNVTLSNRVNVSGTVTLILEKGCKLTASQGINVPSDSSLTIQGEGELEATGGTGAGIGGNSEESSGTITINGGTVTATGGMSGAGIGGGWKGSGIVIINGGTVTATSGPGNSSNNGGAGIGGGNQGSGTVTITGGIVTAKAAEGNHDNKGSSGAGIGGGSNGAGTVTISGTAQVEATGSTFGGGGAGIGGGKSGKGIVTISGTAQVVAVGGTGAGIGDGISGSGSTFSTVKDGVAGKAWIEASSISDTDDTSTWSGIIFQGNNGGVYGNQTLNSGTEIPSGKTLTVTKGATLTISSGATLTSNNSLTIAPGGSITGGGTITGEGTFTTKNLTTALISVPTDLVYNGDDQSENIKNGLKLPTDPVSICGKDFQFDATGWVPSVVKNDDSELEYTVTYIHDDDSSTAVTKTVTLLKSGTTLTAASNKTDYAYSDTITINATVKPSGEAPAAAMLATFAEPTAGQIAVYDGEKQISDPQTPDADGACTLTVATKDLGAGAHTLTVKYVASDVMAAATVDVNVLNVAECTHPNITFDENSRFYCSGCGEYIVARTDVGNDYAYYTSIEAAWDAAVAAGQEASVTLERGGTANTAKTLTVPSGANITLFGSKFNPLTSNCDCIRVDGGTLNIENAYITASNGHAVVVDSGTLKIINGNYTGNTCGLYVSGGNVTLSGGIFNEIKTSGGKYLDSLLADGYAYKMDDSVWIPGTYVKTCTAFSEYLTSPYTKAEVLELPIKDANATPETAEVTYGYTADNAPVLTVTTTATDTPTYQWWELDENGSLKNEISGATSQTLTVPIGLSAGEYKFGCIVSLDGFNLLSTSVTVTVQPKPLTITGAALSPKTYDGTSDAVVTGVTFDGLVGSDSLTFGTDYTATAAFADANSGTGKNATVTVTLGDTVKNYTLPQNTFTLTNQSIGKANVTLTFSDQTITYGSDPTLATAVPAAEITYSYTADGNTVNGLPENAGTYTVTATVTETDNYSGATATSALTINKADHPSNKPGSTMSVPKSCEKVGGATLPEGWEWSDPDKEKALEIGTPLTATAVYTAVDKYNYNNLTATIAITRSNCDHLNTEVRGAVAATCTDPGYTGDTYCANCGEKLSAGTATPLAAHTERSEITKPATYTDEGMKTITCSVCNSFIREETIPKLVKPSGGGSSGGSSRPSGGGSSSPHIPSEPDTPDDTEKPYIKGDDSSAGWLDIRDEVDAADDGSKITVEMNGVTEVPGFVLNSIKGEDITIVFDMGDGVSWSVNGKDVKEATGSIDLGVTVGSSGIPVDVINNVTGENYSIQLSLSYDGEFGFKATLSVDLGTRSAGCYASLYYYNEQSGEPEFISECKITENGTANLEFTHASDYIIVVNEKSRFDKDDTSGSSGNSDISESSDTSDSSDTSVSSTDSGESSPASDDSSGSSTTSGGSRPAEDNPDTGTNIPYIAFLIAVVGAIVLFVTMHKRKDIGR